MYKRVTRFTAQISALVTGAQKDRIEALSYADEVATAEVIRGALALGLARLGRPVQVMRFDELEADGQYDGVVAAYSLLHVPRAGLPAVLEAMRAGAL